MASTRAARYGGINVARNYFLAMSAGGFAGLGGALDILGWQFRLGVLDVQSTQIGYIGIAVALLGRNTAIGVGLSALLFGALLTGTSTRTLDPSVFPPELAGNLTKMIQALVLLFIGADLLILYLWQARRKLRLGRRTPPAQESRHSRPSRAAADRLACARSARRRDSGDRLRRARVLARAAADRDDGPPASGVLRHARRRSGDLGDHTGREAGRLGGGGSRDLRGRARLPRDRSGRTNLDEVVVWSALLASMLRFATPLTFAAIGGMFSERSGVISIGLEGMMLAGAFFGILGADKTNSWVLGLLAAMAGGALALIHAFFAIHLRADQIVGGTAVSFLAVGVTGYFFIGIYGSEGTPSDIPEVRTCTCRRSRTFRSSETSSGT